MSDHPEIALVIDNDFSVSRTQFISAIPVSYTHLNKLLESYTTAMNQTVEQLRESFSEEQLDFFKHRASMNKASSSPALASGLASASSSVTLALSQRRSRALFMLARCLKKSSCSSLRCV